MRDRFRSTGLVLAGLCAGIALVICCEGGPGNSDAGDDGGGGMGDGGGMGGGGMGGPSKVIFASEDANQIETGMVPYGGGMLDCYIRNTTTIGSYPRACVQVLSGPFVLTDLASQVGAGQGGAFVAQNDSEINMNTFRPRWQVGPGSTNGHGMKLYVKPNEKLYMYMVSYPSGVVWSGYRPY